MLTDIWLQDNAVGDMVAQLPWVADGVVEREMSVLRIVAGEMDTDREKTTLSLMSLWFAEDVKNAEASAFASLAEIARTDSELAQSVISRGWLTDGLTADESDALAMVLDIARADLELAKSSVGRPWFVDGGIADGWSSLEVVHGIASEDLALAIRLMKHPWLVDDGPSDQWRSLGYLVGIIRPESKLLGEAIGSPLPTEGATRTQSDGLRLLSTIAQLDLGLAGQIVSRPWFAEGESADEWGQLWQLHDMTQLDVDLARAVVGFPWLIDGGTPHQEQIFGTVLATARTDLALAKRVMNYPWFLDGVTEDELQTLYPLHDIAQQDVELGRLVARFPWMFDNLTVAESGTLVVLGELAAVDLQLARSKANYLKSVNPLTDGEFIKLALGLPDTADDPTVALQGDLTDHIIQSLLENVRSNTRYLHRLGTQPLLRDGLDPQEAAFVVAVITAVGIDPDLFEDLLRSHYVKTKTVSLPLANEVNIWAIQNAPFPQDDGVLDDIEKLVRIAESFMRTPFPTTDIVLLIPVWGHQEESRDWGAGAHFGYAMYLSRYRDHQIEAIAHETAHYYFSVGPRWYSEGGATFMDFYATDPDRILEVDETPHEWCDELENIQHHVHQRRGGLCAYILGTHFLSNLYSTLGEEATSNAMREVFLAAHEHERTGDIGPGRPATEEAIYDAFLKHTPAERKQEFVELYRRLHGGRFAYPDTDTSDDHGDEPAATTPVDVGDLVEGSLDYALDFDYFRFSAKKFQKYRITVNHGSLAPTSITLLATDGVIEESERWKSRTQTPDGPQILWVAPSSGDYYFAIQNFGGKTGQYTFAITAEDQVDDHGDNPTDATPVSIGKVVQGALEEDFDYDFFRLHATQGQTYRAVATNSKGLRFAVYLSDGVTSPEYDDVSRWKYYERDDIWELVGDRRIVEWVAPADGALYLAIDHPDGDVAAYTLTVKAVDN